MIGVFPNLSSYRWRRHVQGTPLPEKKLKKNLYLIHIRNTLNHKIRNTLELKKKKLSVLLSSQKKKKKLVTEPSPMHTASQAQHNPEVANPWILTQKKKKEKKKNQYRANQKSIHSHVVGRENQIQSIQSKSKPNPITQYCNTEVFIKKQTQYRANQTPDPEQTKPMVRRSCRSQAQLASSLVVLV